MAVAFAEFGGGDAYVLVEGAAEPAHRLVAGFKGYFLDTLVGSGEQVLGKIDSLLYGIVRHGHSCHSLELLPQQGVAHPQSACYFCRRYVTAYALSQKGLGPLYLVYVLRIGNEEVGRFVGDVSEQGVDESADGLLGPEFFEFGKGEYALVKVADRVAHTYVYDAFLPVEHIRNHFVEMVIALESNPHFGPARLLVGVVGMLLSRVNEYDVSS